jgi:hypothetical protein
MKSRPWSGGRLPLTSLERRPHTIDELQDRLAVRRVLPGSAGAREPSRLGDRSVRFPVSG